MTNAVRERNRALLLSVSNYRQLRKIQESKFRVGNRTTLDMTLYARIIHENECVSFTQKKISGPFSVIHVSHLI